MTKFSDVQLKIDANVPEFDFRCPDPVVRHEPHLSSDVHVLLYLQAQFLAADWAAGQSSAS